MSLLLDTQVFLWFESGSAKLSDFLRRTMAGNWTSMSARRHSWRSRSSSEQASSRSGLATRRSARGGLFRTGGRRRGR